MQLSFRDDHDACICANCIVSVEAFFKYKAKCVENDRLLRRKRVSFFAGLGLAAGVADPHGDGDDAHRQILQQSKRRWNGLELVDSDEENDGSGEGDVDRKRQRTLLAGEGGKPFNGTRDHHEEAEVDGGGSNDETEANRGQLYGVKQEVIDEEEATAHLRQPDEGDDEDDEEYFNPNQFLAQETKIEDGEGGEQEVSSDGTGGVGGDGRTVNGSSNEDAGSVTSYERAWRTTEFAPQPGASGLRTLKITDYSNVTGKRGRAQRFEAGDMLPASSSNHLLAYHQREVVYRELQRLNGIAASEPTKKVQKFLDDGLRELIYNAGAPNPHYSRDGGSTNFKVVKARFNSYNIIFDDNRFLRRNKSVSGLPKWYWACSVTGCPVKICSYAGRLFKTNELSHTHTPTEPDADSRYETIQPDPHEAEQLQRQLLLQQQQQHQAQQQRLLRQQQQQQMMRQRQMELAQRRVLATAALMAAAAASANRNEEVMVERSKKQPAVGERQSAGGEELPDRWSNYELRRADDGTEMLVSAGHIHRLILTRKDGVRVYRCTSVTARRGEAGEGDDGRPCTDTVFLRADGRLAKVCKEENADYDMELPDERKDDGAAGVGGAAIEDDDKRRRPQKIIVYEGYRYKYCHARPEGSFYWRCVLRHEKDCLASIQTKRNLEFLNVNDQLHNHDPPDPSEPHENAMLCEIRLPAKGEEAEGSTDFKLVKSGQKREFLIYKGYRYYFQYESKNGRRSYRCTMFKNCPAGAFLLPNNTIQEAKNFIHTHPPVEDMEKYITKDSLITSPTKSWVKSVDGGDAAAMAAWKAAQGAAGESSSSRGSTATIEPLSKDPEVARKNGYRIIKNYKNKEIMIYLGWRYFEDYKNKSGGQVWRCSSHRLCRGTVHLFPDGSINFAKLVDHNHSPPRKTLNHKTVTGDKIDELDGSTEQLDGSGDVLPRGSGSVHRYIAHQGHRFRFATRKREGTIYWRCAMRLETKCPVSFHTREDSYELVSTRNHEHNHPIPTVWPEVAGGQIDEELPKVRLPAEEIGTTDFILTKNSKGRDLVLYRNGRFYLDYSRKDGKIVFRCSAASGCRATLLLLPNKTLQVPEDFSHNHRTVDGWSEQPLKTDEDGEDDGEETASNGVPGEGGFERSRLDTTLPKLVLHNGFHYRFVSRHPTEQSAFYRCCNFDVKKYQCHASLYTDLSGVVIQTSQQPHNHEQGDYLEGPSVKATASPQQLDTADLVGTRDYKIVKNWKNRDVLVFQNCRYFLHYVRKDGRKVWRCSAIRSCHAAVYLNADGTVDQFRGQHVHEIRPEGEPRRRRRRRKAEMMFPYGASAPSVTGAGNRTASTMASMFGNGMMTPAELLARAGGGGGSAINGSGGQGMMNGSTMAMAAAAAAAMINGVTNGGGGPTAGGNEWIDYSDYAMQMTAPGNDTGHGRGHEENHSLWDQFHPHQGLSESGGGEGDSFDFSYHSVFGNQESFNSYTAHALAQHHLQQQQQQQQQHHRHIQQQIQQRMQLLNGHYQQRQQEQQPHVIDDSSDAEEYEPSGEADDDQPIIVPEVKIESDDL
uniref:FLYWCH-type domain-containing protein n=1 Tax=Anopheles atroparvus TaxID=41427 RepID=A0A182J0Y3_ANOAO